jgi:hypothetical protein
MKRTLPTIYEARKTRGLSPFKRFKHPRKRHVRVRVLPQSQRRPWLYRKAKP